MKKIFGLTVLILSFNLSATTELSAEQMEGLSECDYFKYTECTGAGLTIGKCIKTKYSAFAKVCGDVHAENFKYSREMYKPKKSKSSKASCDSVKEKLCFANSLSMSQCASKYKKELSGACGGEDFIKGALAASEMDECFTLQKKICGDEVTPECDAIFQKKAPKKCTATPVPSKKIGKGQTVSSATLMKDCASTIKNSPCKLDENEISKKGVDVHEYLRKYKICLERSIKKSKGKCGSHIPDIKGTKDKMEKEKAAGKKWNKPGD